MSPERVKCFSSRVASFHAKLYFERALCSCVLKLIEFYLAPISATWQMLQITGLTLS